MTYDEFTKLVADLFPAGYIQELEGGELVINTGLFTNALDMLETMREAF
jgi:hypothetical protein